MKIDFFNKMDLKFILLTYMNIVNKQLSGLNMIPYLMYLSSLIVFSIDKNDYTSTYLLFSFIISVLSINFVVKKFRIVFYSTIFLMLLKGYILVELESTVIYLILFILLLTFDKRLKEIKINKDNVKEISQRIITLVFALGASIIVLINDIYTRINIYVNNVDSLSGDTFGFIIFIFGIAAFVIGVYFMVRVLLLILNEALNKYYSDFYNYVMEYNYTKSDILNLQLGLLENYIVNYNKNENYFIPFSKGIKDKLNSKVELEGTFKKTNILKKYPSEFYFRFKLNNDNGNFLSLKGISWKILHSQTEETFTKEEIENYEKEFIFIHKTEKSNFMYLTGDVDFKNFSFGEKPDEIKGRTLNSILDIHDPIEKQKLIKLFIKHNPPRILLDEFYQADFKENLIVSYENIEILRFATESFIEKLENKKEDPSEILNNLVKTDEIIKFHYCLASNILIKTNNIYLPGGIKNKIQKAYKEIGIKSYPTFGFEEVILFTIQQNMLDINDE